ncbi:IS66 family transposase [Aquisalimonas sp. 2447]|uniref:IS66 family transposase n=1 Tax=Aquisalimonas sp. 2447 TaxID=2740807 RepID=UPI0014326B53|nr:IS66 family transposase [Aquisalimonas sp. 2447]QIT57188.1 IS66 family transposase [Aquisalimonas sp. 2447]QIT57238.1 IS66 family transposase [Aquisalimonas sp. 2447]QIT57244.1 IS66 family transposase [Aquisalimonas sp. 2447]QIT57246.1 IS66 family transposase [Aquisalimonas sp. 2447]
MRRQLAWFKRQLFGEKSERHHILDPAVQVNLFEATATPVPEQGERERISYTRSKGKNRDDAANDTGLRFDDSVPRRVIEVPPPAGCATDEVVATRTTFRLAQRRAGYEVLEYRHPVLKDRSSGALTSVPAPRNVFEGSVFDVSFAAGVLVDKFCYHLPLYRQSQRLSQAGIQVARSSLTAVVARTAALLEPIARAQLTHVLSGGVLAMDETPIKAGRKGPGKMHQAYFWPLYGDSDEICFTFSPSRAGAHIERTLADRFHGVLLTDGYAAYEKYAAGQPQITHAQCWSHMRRQFERALETDPAAREALAQIGQLYAQEQSIRERGLHGADKRHARREQCAPLVRAFWEWCDAQLQRMDLEPRHPLLKALGYVRERQPALAVFLEHPDVPIDTNHLERGLRAIPMGRRNWLFCWSEVGAAHVATIQTLLVTCRLQGVDPTTYLVDVLQRVGMHPAARVEELTPRRWKALFNDAPLRSDIER